MLKTKSDNNPQMFKRKSMHSQRFVLLGRTFNKTAKLVLTSSEMRKKEVLSRVESSIEPCYMKFCDQNLTP